MDLKAKNFSNQYRLTKALNKTEKPLYHNNQITIYESEDGEARIEVRKELDEKAVTEECSVTARREIDFLTRPGK